MIRYFMQALAWMVFMAALILWPAGTLVFPAAWVLLGIFTLGSFATIIWLARYSPGLLRERMASPVQREQKLWDRCWLLCFLLAFFGWMAFMGWDAARTGFNAMPLWLQVVGAVGILAEMLGVWWTFRENTFAVPVVKIQQDQQVIDTGPYAIVRHPMYASALFLLVGMPLLLGSWLGLACSGLFILALAWRTVHEEQTLRAELDGYQDYTARVRYRFIPFIW